MFIQKRRITANEDVDVAAEAADLLFETEDVAELLAEVTNEVVEVETDGEDVVFSVGEDVYTVTPEGDEEILESSRRNFRNKRTVSATRKVAKKAPVKASTRRPVKKSVRK